MKMGEGHPPGGSGYLHIKYSDMYMLPLCRTIISHSLFLPIYRYIVVSEDESPCPFFCFEFLAQKLRWRIKRLPMGIGIAVVPPLCRQGPL